MLAAAQCLLLKTSVSQGCLLLTGCDRADCKQANALVPAKDALSFFFFPLVFFLSEKLKAGAPERWVCLLSEGGRKDHLVQKVLREQLRAEPGP